MTENEIRFKYVESSSKPGTFYRVEEEKVTIVTCTCPGFNHHNKCKHILQGDN